MQNETVFDDVAPWPEPKTIADGRDAKLDNAPPLEDRIVLDFTDDLAREGITARIAELLASAQRVPETIDGDGIAGKVGDLLKLTNIVAKRVDAVRETHNRPLITAKNALKAKADGALADLLAATTAIRFELDRYMREQARQRDEERRRAEEAARRANEAARASAQPDEPLPVISAPRVAAPVTRGDLGARVGTKTVWLHEVEVPIKQLPKALLESATVREAVDKVIGQMIRAGTREIKGVRIWSEQKANIT